jgi:hypothetical protein
LKTLRALYPLIPSTSFTSRKEFWKQKGAGYVVARVGGIEDPAMMNTTMQMMSKNMMMFVPQTMIMSWVSFVFTGFVLTRLPFPLTLRFKSMLQSGVDTTDMDVRWVSSLSWYFLLLFGLNSVYTLIGGESDASAMMPQAMPPPMQQPGEMQKLFQNEIEFLDLVDTKPDDVLDRVLHQFGAVVPVNKKTQ